jgi:hypothetical protein
MKLRFVKSPLAATNFHGFFRPAAGFALRSAGLTLIDVLIVIVTLGLLIVFALTRVTTRCVPASRISCVNNLKQVGLAARMWSADHGNVFPWSVSMNSNGVKEIAMSGNVAAIFLRMTNELSSPNILSCPNDAKRKRESDFWKLANSNISYFIGLDADEHIPQTILSGDRNISGGIVTSNRVMVIRSTNLMRWGTDIHGHAGNIGLGDGSVQQVNDTWLQSQVRSQATNGVAVARLAFP